MADYHNIKATMCALQAKDVAVCVWKMHFT